MKLRNTLILFIVFVLLAGYVYFVEFKKHEKEKKAKEEEKKVFTFEKDSVTTIYFSNFNGKFTVKKIQNEWRITEPLYTSAEESTINSMLSSLTGAKKETEFLIQPEEIGQYGLAANAVFVRMETTQGESDSIWLGQKTPVGSFVFASKTDSLVFTTNQSVKTSFEKKLFDIRDKNLLHFKQSDVRKVILKNNYGKLEFEKVGGSDWNFINIDRPADNGKLSTILSRLSNNKVKSFVDEEGKETRKYGISNPAIEVDLFLGPTQGEKNIKISKKIKGKYYAKDKARKPIFEIDSSLVKELNKKVNEFRDKDFADFNRSDINKITIAYKDTVFSCIKDTSDNWMLDDETSRLLIKNKISSFFSSLDYAQISEFVKDGQINEAIYGLNKPALKVSLFKDNELILEAKLGKTKDTNIYARTNKYDSVYLLPDAKLDDFKLNLNDILEPIVEKSEDETED